MNEEEQTEKHGADDKPSRSRKEHRNALIKNEPPYTPFYIFAVSSRGKGVDNCRLTEVCLCSIFVL